MATPSGGSSPIEGRYGRFSCDGAHANVEQFTGEVTTDRVEATGLEDQSVLTGRTAQVITDGLDKCTANVKGYVDYDNMPRGAYGMSAGSVVINVFLYLVKGDATRCINMPYAKVVRVNYQVQLKDKIMFDVNIENSGPFTGIGGTADSSALAQYQTGSRLPHQNTTSN